LTPGVGALLLLLLLSRLQCCMLLCGKTQLLSIGA
jgi:hypothetical protein